jgi:hypothetical protein
MTSKRFLMRLLDDNARRERTELFNTRFKYIKIRILFV